LKAERAWFLSGMERGAKPETEQLLTRWGKSCVFSESTVLSLNILAARLYRVSSKSDSGRLNLQRSLHPSPNIYQDMFYPHKMEENRLLFYFIRLSRFNYMQEIKVICFHLISIKREMVKANQLFNLLYGMNYKLRE